MGNSFFQPSKRRDGLGMQIQDNGRSRKEKKRDTIEECETQLNLMPSLEFDIRNLFVPSDFLKVEEALEFSRGSVFIVFHVDLFFKVLRSQKQAIERTFGESIYGVSGKLFPSENDPLHGNPTTTTGGETGGIEPEIQPLQEELRNNLVTLSTNSVSVLLDALKSAEEKRKKEQQVVDEEKQSRKIEGQGGGRASFNPFDDILLLKVTKIRRYSLTNTDGESEVKEMLTMLKERILPLLETGNSLLEEYCREILIKKIDSLVNVISENPSVVMKEEGDNKKKGDGGDKGDGEVKEKSGDGTARGSAGNASAESLIDLAQYSLFNEKKWKAVLKGSSTLAETETRRDQFHEYFKESEREKRMLALRQKWVGVRGAFVEQFRDLFECLMIATYPQFNDEKRKLLKWFGYNVTTVESEHKTVKVGVRLMKSIPQKMMKGLSTTFKRGFDEKWVENGKSGNIQIATSSEKSFKFEISSSTTSAEDGDEEGKKKGKKPKTEDNSIEIAGDSSSYCFFYLKKEAVLFIRARDVMDKKLILLQTSHQNGKVSQMIISSLNQRNVPHLGKESMEVEMRCRVRSSNDVKTWPLKGPDERWKMEIVFPISKFAEQISRLVDDGDRVTFLLEDVPDEHNTRHRAFIKARVKGSLFSTGEILKFFEIDLAKDYCFFEPSSLATPSSPGTSSPSGSLPNLHFPLDRARGNMSPGCSLPLTKQRKNFIVTFVHRDLLNPRNFIIKFNGNFEEKEDFLEYLRAESVEQLEKEEIHLLKNEYRDFEVFNPLKRKGSFLTDVSKTIFGGLCEGGPVREREDEDATISLRKSIVERTMKVLLRKQYFVTTKGGQPNEERASRVAKRLMEYNEGKDDVEFAHRLYHDIYVNTIFIDYYPKRSWKDNIVEYVEDNRGEVKRVLEKKKNIFHEMRSREKFYEKSYYFWNEDDLKEWCENYVHETGRGKSRKAVTLLPNSRVKSTHCFFEWKDYLSYKEKMKKEKGERPHWIVFPEFIDDLPPEKIINVYDITSFFKTKVNKRKLRYHTMTQKKLNYFNDYHYKALAELEKIKEKLLGGRHSMKVREDVEKYFRTGKHFHSVFVPVYDEEFKQPNSPEDFDMIINAMNAGAKKKMESIVRMCSDFSSQFYLITGSKTMDLNESYTVRVKINFSSSSNEGHVANRSFTGKALKFVNKNVALMDFLAPNFGSFHVGICFGGMKIDYGDSGFLSYHSIRREDAPKTKTGEEPKNIFRNVLLSADLYLVKWLNYFFNWNCKVDYHHTKSNCKVFVDEVVGRLAKSSSFDVSTSLNFFGREQEIWKWAIEEQNKKEKTCFITFDEKFRRYFPHVKQEKFVFTKHEDVLALMLLIMDKSVENYIKFLKKYPGKYALLKGFCRGFRLRMKKSLLDSVHIECFFDSNEHGINTFGCNVEF